MSALIKTIIRQCKSVSALIKTIIRQCKSVSALHDDPHSHCYHSHQEEEEEEGHEYGVRLGSSPGSQ